MKGPDLRNINSGIESFESGLTVEISNSVPANKAVKPGNGNTISLSRKWDRGKLELTPANLEGQFKLAREQFLASVVFGQGKPLFVDLDPSLRLQVFEELLNLGIYSDASDRAKKIAGLLDAIVRSLEINDSRLAGVLSAMPSFEQIESDIAQLERQHQAALAELDTKSRALDSQIAKLEGRSKEIRGNLDTATTTLRDFDDVRNSMQECEREWHGLENTFARKRDARDREEYTLKALLDVGVCSECGQGLPAKLRAERKSALDIKIGDLMRQIAVTTSRINELVALIEEARKALEGRDDAVREVTRLHGEWVSLDNDLKARRDEKLNLRADETRLQQALDSAQQRLEQIVDQRSKVIAEQAEVAAQLKRLRGKLEGMKSLQNAFREMRFIVIEQTLEYLNLEANALLSRFGMPTTKINFATRARTKSGDIAARPSLSVAVERDGKVLPLSAYSGGERQRLRIACAMGLATVIQNVAGIEFGFEVWDEPSSWLSQDGVTTLLQVLQERAERYQKRILLTDHRMLDFGGFDHVVMIEKDERGNSRIIQDTKFSGE